MPKRHRFGDDSIEDLIEWKTGTGDYYPLLGDAIRRGGRGPGKFKESVNLVGTVQATEDGWFGFRLHLMFPDRAQAGILIPQLLDVLRREELGSAEVLRKQFDAMMDGSSGLVPIKLMWSDDCGDLTRHRRPVTGGSDTR